MRIHQRYTIWALVAIAAWVVTAAAQETKTTPEAGNTLKIEGTVTGVTLATRPGPPSLTVKDKDGKEYIVHFGPLAPLRRQGFNPKVGETVTVSGLACCEMDKKLMVHSKEITVAGKTFSTPLPPEQMMQMNPGAPMGTMGCCQQGGAAGCPGCAQMMQHGAEHCPNCPHQEMHH